MSRKCCVYGCKTNYDRKKCSATSSCEKIPVYRLPSDEQEKNKWIQAVPNADFTVSRNTVICELHRPKNFEIVKTRGGKLRPKNPPSVWPGIPPSQVLTPSAPKRTTQRASSTLRNFQEDELKRFSYEYKVSFSTLKEELMNKGKKHEHQHSVLSIALKNCVIIQSNQFINGISLFVIKVDENLNFETYHCGIECKIPSLSSNRITTVNTWLVLNEMLRFLTLLQPDTKKKCFYNKLQL